MKTVTLFVALVLALSGCLTLPPPPPTDSGRVIETGIGQEFQIVLEADHTTPYRWAISGALSNVELVSNQYRPRLTRRAPRPGVEIWTFRALSSGETTITFHLESQDSANPAPAQSVSFTVSVK